MKHDKQIAAIAGTHADYTDWARRAPIQCLMDTTTDDDQTPGKGRLRVLVVLMPSPPINRMC